MKILLIAPSDKKFLTNAGDRVPLGLLYVASSLAKLNHNVVIYDMNHETDADLLTDVVKNNYDYIGLGFTTPQYNEAIRIFEYLKDFSNAKFIAGGVHPTIDPASCSMFDYIVIGEGETAILDIINGYKGKIYQSKFVDDLDDITPPARHLLDMSRYNMMIEDKRTATMITSRGCTGHCIYCSRTNGQKIRMHSASYIFFEMAGLHIKYGFTSFYFLDDTFTADEKRIKQLETLIGLSGFKFDIRVTTRANLINENIVKSLKNIGVKIISLGIEHIDDNVLKKANKGMTISDNEKAIELIHKYDMKVKGFFILNLPGASKESIEKTINWAKENVDYADYYSLTAFPGTPVWNYPERLGLKLLSKEYNFWEATKDEINFNIENPAIPNNYLKEKLMELRAK